MKRRWLAMAGIALATLSCQLILGLEEPTGVPAPVAEEEPDAGVTDPCRHSLRPKAPAKDDDPDTKKEFWFATKSVAAPLPAGQGFDLDNACTCMADLHDGGPPCTLAKTVCDLDGGIDDAVGVLFGDLSRTFPFDPLKPVNDGLSRGSRTLLLYLSDYNGKANDADVKVGFVNSGGLYTDVGCDDVTSRGLEITFADDGAHTPPGKNRYRPAFDGCDHWSPEDGILVAGERTPGIRVTAYVTDFQLVIAIDQVATAVFGARVTIQSALFVAKIVPEDNHLRLDGVLAGRLPFEDLIQTLGGNEAGNFGNKDAGDDYTAVCDVPLIWNQAVPRLCGARDTMASAAEDFNAKPRACNATSLNFGFTMVESKLADFDFTNRVVSKACAPVTCP